MALSLSVVRRWTERAGALPLRASQVRLVVYTRAAVVFCITTGRAGRNEFGAGPHHRTYYTLTGAKLHVGANNRLKEHSVRRLFFGGVFSHVRLVDNRENDRSFVEPATVN